MPRFCHRFASLLGLSLMLTGVPAFADARLNLVATTGMVADIVSQIGGERVEVQGLMGPGVDPHLYRQTRSDVVAMSRADAVFWNGLNLEVQLAELLGRLGKRSPVFAVGEAVPREVLLADEDYADQPDPHIWMDPGRWRHAVMAARDALVELDPEGSDAFEARAEAYLEELDDLDAYARKVLASIPDTSRALVTAHDAFGYFGEAYALEVMGIQGFSTESEAGLSRIETLVDLLVEREIGAIFVETSVSERSIRALIEGSAAVGHEVRIGGELFSDAMGPEGSYEGSWLGMLDHNITTIARALGGDAPEAGWQGRLGMDAPHTDEEE